MQIKRPYNLRMRLLSYLVIFYLLLAFTWWTVLLFTKNRDAFKAKSELNQVILAAKGEIKSKEEFLISQDYQFLKKKYQSQEWMIAGEAVFFVVSLIIGVWLINRGYNKEVNAAEQRRNFLLSITHELKSPIASIRLVLETFLKRSLKGEQIDKLGTAALKETERLHNLVNDLLLSAKLETVYLLNRESIDLATLLLEMAEAIRTRHPNAEIRLIDVEKSVFIEGDQMGLNSVILNLLENAVKYSGALPVVEVNLSETKAQAIIQISDNGIGIDDREKKKIFEKFYRVGSEDTRKTKGTGLGLYIVKQIVKAHHGTIEVSDNQPRGTIFSITLPKE